ncbi:ATP synthase F0 subunit B [Desulforhopalus singaporensis]|uniref:ATP synthase subunit b n=1 Tax=Desulforhopalus singaporensis TaxID=91360 RepID=A0A1H0JQK8_9BACT|nr:ATP synthase F0 subunit B [Desulforhopalus singaporensis]SDO45864.1 F-type H+-transporting ATPase subunit b [Desulforhopalus singaporensis]
MVTMDITLFIQIVNMVVLMFLLNGVLYKPIRKIIRERSEKLEGMQEEILDFEKNAALRQEDVDAKMAQASGRAKRALDSARADAQKAGDEKLSAIKAEVEAERDKKLADLKSQIDSAKTSLHDGLEGFASDMASKILGRSL